MKTILVLIGGGDRDQLSCKPRWRRHSRCRLIWTVFIFMSAQAKPLGTLALSLRWALLFGGPWRNWVARRNPFRTLPQIMSAIFARVPQSRFATRPVIREM